MMYKRCILLTLMALTAAFATVSAKRPLNHDDFDSWESARINAISADGVWSAYSVVPQEGDGMLTLRNNRKGKTIEIARGYKPSFSADGKWAVLLIKPFSADTRQAKIKKKKDFDLPQDTLAIVELATGRIEKISNVTGFKIGERGGNFVAYQTCDTLYIKPKDLKDKKSGKPLVIRSLTSPANKVVKWVDDYGFSRDGSKLAFSMRAPEKDSLSTSGVGFINLPDTSLVLLDRDKKFYTVPVFNEAATALAYTSSNDSTETGTKLVTLTYASIAGEEVHSPAFHDIDVFFSEREPVNLALPHADDPATQRILEKERALKIEKSMGQTFYLNQYSKPKFSRNGRFLIIDAAPRIAPDDTTLVDFEKAGLDIWRWDAPYTPPQEKANLKKLREAGMPVVIDLQNDFSQRMLTMNSLVDVHPSFGWNSEWALLSDPTEKIVSRQWNYAGPEELIAVNVLTGEKRKVATVPAESSNISPDGRFIVWYDNSRYYAYEIASGKTSDLTPAIPYPVWDERDDHPMTPAPYGIAGWAENPARVLIYDRYDIWAVDPTGAAKPECLTAGDGRKTGRQYRYRRFNKEENPFVAPGETMVLTVFDETDKRSGLGVMKYGKPAAPSVKVLDKYTFTSLTKARDAQTYMWLRGNFETMPDVWESNSTDFNKAVKLTSINPQLKDILWGTAQLVEWTTYDGHKSKGVLYLPENFDASAEASIPMISYFYERYSDDVYRHYTMEPSWSWINFPFYTSRGYVIFVPDIIYDMSGMPGESAYNYVCSGVEEMCRRYPAIDPKRIGIDGQSWGGYQTAYLVTRTNMFACAGSGAPVANMTSAFGGIRWGTGDSRQGQYEMGQSRIGRNLWEAPELYILNSPLFRADKVNTPLLIMHNDNDGAVPWYQGIELFMALRRLEKPVWLLEYNGESHNIKERRNRKDITKRLQQFFDHYLLGAPMPRWMKEGISPLRKGQDFGF